MTDLSPQEILDAIRRGLEATSRQFKNKNQSQSVQLSSQGSNNVDDVKEMPHVEGRKANSDRTRP